MVLSKKDYDRNGGVTHMRTHKYLSSVFLFRFCLNDLDASVKNDGSMKSSYKSL